MMPCCERPESLVSLAARRTGALGVASGSKTMSVLMREEAALRALADAASSGQLANWAGRCLRGNQKTPENLRIYRLGQMRVESCLMRAPPVGLLPPTCQCHQRHSVPPRFLAYATDHFVTSGTRHADIQ